MNSQQAKENFDRYSVYMGPLGDVLLEDDFIALVGEDMALLIQNQHAEKGMFCKIRAPWGETLTVYTLKGYLQAVKLINAGEMYDNRGIHDNGEAEEELPGLPENVVILQRSGKSNGKGS